MKGLICKIYTDGRDFSNGGLSSRVREVTLIVPGKEIGPFEPKPERPAVELVMRNICGELYTHAVEVGREAKANEVGPMFGGSFIYCTDSRFPNSYPIPLHDRYESQKLCDRLST